MKPSDIKYLSRKIMEAGEIPLIWGHFGVGKTDIARDIARETNRELIILIISQMEPGDLIGMPARGENKTIFLKPDWWPEKDETLILIDEINRAHRSIRNAIMQLILDRRIHNHILPKGTWIMAAANPPDEDYDQVDLITDPAFMSRFFHLDLNPDPSDWKVWAKDNQVSDQVIDFINSYPEYLSDNRIVSLRWRIKPSPRSWYKLSRVFSYLDKEDIEKYGYVLAAGIVGPEAARAFINYIRSGDKIPSAEEILEMRYDSVFDRIKSLDFSQKSGVILRLNRYFENIDDIKAKELLQNTEYKRYAKAIKKLSDLIPKDSIFSILRHLENLSKDSKGYKRAFIEKLLEEIAFEIGAQEWLEEI